MSGGWRHGAGSGDRETVARTCIRATCQAPYFPGAASLAGVQLVWITPSAHSPGRPLSVPWSVLGASCPVVIDSIGTSVPSTYTVTTAPPLPGSASTRMGGAALAEVVAAVTANRAPTKERTTLLISATFLHSDPAAVAGPAAHASSDHSPVRGSGRAVRDRRRDAHRRGGRPRSADGL